MKERLREALSTVHVYELRDRLRLGVVAQQMSGSLDLRYSYVHTVWMHWKLYRERRHEQADNLYRSSMLGRFWAVWQFAVEMEKPESMGTKVLSVVFEGAMMRWRGDLLGTVRDQLAGLQDEEDELKRQLKAMKMKLMDELKKHADALSAEKAKHVMLDGMILGCPKLARGLFLSEHAKEAQNIAVKANFKDWAKDLGLQSFRVLDQFLEEHMEDAGKLEPLPHLQDKAAEQFVQALGSMSALKVDVGTNTDSTITRSKSRRHIDTEAAGFMDLEDLFEHIGAILERKVVADRSDDEEEHPRDRLGHFVQEYFSVLCGVPSITRMKLKQFKAGIRIECNKNRRVFWFGFMMGFIEPKRHRNMLVDIFLLFLKCLVPEQEIAHEMCFREEEAANAKVSVATALKAVHDVFSPFQGIDAATLASRLYERSEYGQGIGRYIDLDVAIDLVLTVLRRHFDDMEERFQTALDDRESKYVVTYGARWLAPAPKIPTYPGCHLYISAQTACLSPPPPPPSAHTETACVSSV
jgi:hypothetical protein